MTKRYALSLKKNTTVEGNRHGHEARTYTFKPFRKAATREEARQIKRDCGKNCYIIDTRTMRIVR